LSFSILTDGKYLMPATNQQLFRSNAMKHYMQGREKHTVPRFISLPIMILLWALLALFLVSGALVWSEQVPRYATTQGIVVVESATQSSGKQVPATGKQVPVTGKSVPATGKQVPVMGKAMLPTAIAVLFLPPAQVNNLHIGTPIRLHVGPSAQQINSQVTSIEPSAMSPTVLHSLFHLENYPLSITQPVAVVMVKLDPAFATAHAGSTLTADVQVGSQSLISLLPGVGSLFGK
jgi:hypothetical protein